MSSIDDVQSGTYGKRPDRKAPLLFIIALETLLSVMDEYCAFIESARSEKSCRPCVKAHFNAHRSLSQMSRSGLRKVAID